jgi:DNA-binding transcriptional MerR regulator
MDKHYPAPPDRGITLTEAAYICGCSERTIRNYQTREVDPFPFPCPSLGPRLYSELEVLEWAGRNAIRAAKIVRG